MSAGDDVQALLEKFDIHVRVELLAELTRILIDDYTARWNYCRDSLPYVAPKPMDISGFYVQTLGLRHKILPWEYGECTDMCAGCGGATGRLCLFRHQVCRPRYYRGKTL